MPFSNFDSRRGLFMRSDCERSADVSFLFDFGALKTDMLAELAQETGGTDTSSEDSMNTDLPWEIMKVLQTNNTYVQLESVAAANSDLIGNEVMKQEEVKETASLFSELEEALKKLN